MQKQIPQIVAEIEATMTRIPAGQIDPCTKKVLKNSKIVIGEVEGITPENMIAVAVACKRAGASNAQMDGIISGISHIVCKVGGREGHMMRLNIRTTMPRQVKAIVG